MKRAFDAATRHPAWTVAVTVVVVAVPYFVLGPHFLADDYVWLRNAHFDGWWNAGGPRVAGRPGGWVVAALSFGAVGAHPAVLYVVLTALRVGAAVLVRRCLAMFMAARYALAVTLVWLVMPNHLATEMWLSSMAGPIALGLLAAGISELARVTRADPRRLPIVAYLLLAGAVAVYELTAGVAALAVAAVPCLVHGRVRVRVRDAAIGLVLVAVPALWAAVRSTVYDHSSTGKLDPRLVFPGHLSLGFAPFGAQGRVVTALGLAAILAAVVRLARRELRPSTGFPDRLVVAGAVVVLAGVAPLASFATNFFGLHDRLLLVSGVGSAMVWTGAALMVAAWLRRPAVLVAAALAFVAVVVPLRAMRTVDYRDAGTDAVRETARLGAAVRASGARAIDVPGPVAVVDRVWGLNDGWNATASVQLHLDDPTVVVGVVLPDIGRSGPPPDRPRAAF